ncbi:N-acetylglucosamine-6-phosphate deacetylase [Deinococcus yavapaiensis]|nr:N-acetylglucosamine-6-phosphate deacetylase [Deinococcus yavapaiensis]
MSTRLQGRILTSRGFVTGAVSFGRTIEDIEAGDAPGRYILPGFIDVHVHGGNGGDTMDGERGVETMARFHGSHGTTSMLPTTVTAPWSNVMSALRGVAEVRSRGVEGGADVLGAHLEGPFISPKRLGAQAPQTILPSASLLEEALALNVVRLTTVAPELEGMDAAARKLSRAGVRVSFGHTVGAYEDAVRVAAAVREEGGTVSGTHLFNAMSGLMGRAPGVLGALLADEAAFAELIFDLHHVYSGAFLAARAAKRGRLLLITDAIRAAGLPDGESELGGQKVFVKNGRATLVDGTLAGSVLTLDVALRNAVKVGVPIEEASRMLSGTPAELLGLSDRGRIEVGLRADFVVLDEALRVLEVYVGGERIA